MTVDPQIKARLAADGVDLTPLLLVQVDSTPKSTDKAVERLLKLDFKKEQVAVNTGNEADPEILALADDEAREVRQPLSQSSFAASREIPFISWGLSRRREAAKDGGIVDCGSWIEEEEMEPPRRQGRQDYGNFGFWILDFGFWMVDGGWWMHCGDCPGAPSPSLARISYPPPCIVAGFSSAADSRGFILADHPERPSRSADSPGKLGFVHRQVAKVDWMSGARHSSWRSWRLGGEFLKFPAFPHPHSGFWC